MELDLYEKAMAARKEMADAAEHARRQQLQRLSYQAELARRCFERCDSDNRLVAAELERRWESALRELRQAEEGEAAGERENEPAPAELTDELKAAFMDIGRRLPEVWDDGLLSRRQKKASLRSLIEKVVLHRITPDLILTRIVWKGGQTTTFEVSTTVGSFADLSGAEEMERLVVKLFKEGNTDKQIARCLTALGHRSPQKRCVVRSTVQTIRHRHGLLRGGRVKAPHARTMSPAASPSPKWPRNWEYPTPGCTTASTMGPSRSSKITRRDSICSPTIRLQSRGSEN